MRPWAIVCSLLLVYGAGIGPAQSDSMTIESVFLGNVGGGATAGEFFYTVKVDTQQRFSLLRVHHGTLSVFSDLAFPALSNAAYEQAVVAANQTFVWIVARIKATGGTEGACGPGHGTAVQECLRVLEFRSCCNGNTLFLRAGVLPDSATLVNAAWVQSGSGIFDCPGCVVLNTAKGLYRYAPGIDNFLRVNGDADIIGPMVTVLDVPYVFGAGPGRDEVRLFDKTVASWSNLPQRMPYGVVGSAVAVSGTEVYLFGGMTPPSACHDEIHVFDASDRSWTVLARRIPQKLSEMRAVKGNDGFVLYGGHIKCVPPSEGGSTFAGSYRYDPRNQAPHAVIGPHPANVATGAAVTFASASTDDSGAISTSRWDFGDGATSSQASFSHAFESAGTYTIRLSVTDQEGASATVTSSIQVTQSGAPGSPSPTPTTSSPSPTPSPAPSGGPSPEPEPEPRSQEPGPPNEAPKASFQANATGLQVSVDAAGASDADGDELTYSWDFGDSTNAQGRRTIHRYAAAGSYEIRLTVTDRHGAAGISARSVEVQSVGPTARISAPTSAIVGEAVTISAATSRAGDAPIATYEWDFGEGIFERMSPTVTHVFTTPGFTWVKLQITDAAGRTSATSLLVSVEGGGAKAGSEWLGGNASGPGVVVAVAIAATALALSRRSRL